MKPLARNAVALLAGAVTGFTVIILWTVGTRVVSMSQGQHQFLIPTGMLAQIVSEIAALCAIGCAIAAVPCWLVLRRLRLASWVSAGALGLVLSELSAITLGKGLDLGFAAVIGAAGVIAGVTTWSAERALSPKVR